MKIHFLIISIFFLSIQLPAQIIIRDNEPIGIHKLVLGESKEQYTTSPPLEGGKYTKDDHEFNIYQYGGTVEIDGIRFNSNLLTFDDSNRLVSFTFLKFYKKSDSPRYEKEAKKSYRQIIDLVTKQLGRKGTNKIYYVSKKITDTGQEWNSKSVLLTVKKTSSIYNSTVEISVSYQGI
jgi:glycerophosphoryl diester phosphodiesterase